MFLYACSDYFFENDEKSLFYMFQAFAKEREMSNLKVGDKVYAKHKNTRYYKATVVKIERQIFCLLDFDDGSFSDDTFPEDIVVCFITVHAFLNCPS